MLYFQSPNSSRATFVSQLGGPAEFIFSHAYCKNYKARVSQANDFSTLTKCQPTGALQFPSPHSLTYVNSLSTLLPHRQMTLFQPCPPYWIPSYHSCRSTYQRTLHRSSGFVTASPHRTLRKPFTTSSFSSIKSVLLVGAAVKMMGTAVRPYLVCKSLE